MPSTYWFIPKFLVQPGLHQCNAKKLENHLGFMEIQKPSCVATQALSSSQDLNQHSCGMLALQAAAQLTAPQYLFFFYVQKKRGMVFIKLFRCVLLISKGGKLGPSDLTHSQPGEESYPGEVFLVTFSPLPSLSALGHIEVRLANCLCA